LGEERGDWGEEKQQSSPCARCYWSLGSAAVVKGKDRARKNKIQEEKNKGRKRGPTKRQRPNENAIGQKQLPTSFSFLPTYQTQKKRNCTRNGYNNRVRHLPFFHLFPFFQC
jgi:hypothetical protein